MPNWEYTIENVKVIERWSAKRQDEEVQAFVSRLNQYGGEGWEMISFETIPLTGAWSDKIKGYMYLAFFKRQK